MDTLLCSLCGQTEREHRCAVAPTLADHLTASLFYDACPGDRAVQLTIYPEERLTLT
jgi:hypothetical protein